jgi:hypothetical protein
LTCEDLAVGSIDATSHGLSRRRRFLGGRVPKPSGLRFSRRES